MGDTPITPVRIPGELKALLKIQAKAEGRSLSNLITRLLDLSVKALCGQCGGSLTETDVSAGHCTQCQARLKA